MSACEIGSETSTSPLAQSAGLPKSPEGDPVFAEPWHAQAFALTVHLHQKQVFSWGEWAQVLSSEVHKPGRADDGSDYFDCWVAALCRLLVEKGVADDDTILSLQESWQRAAEATPHGQPIELSNDPLSQAG